MFNTVAVLAVLTLMGSTVSSAGDWPQILGPARNGIAVDEHLADHWPAQGPQKTWEQSVGSGFAGVAVADGIAVLFHRVGSEDRLTAFKSGSGEEMWVAKFRTTFQPQIVEDDGPRATPTIQSGAVFAYSAQGRLYCVDLKTGNKRWERNTHQDFEATGGYFGAGSAPLVEGSLVVVNVGGDKKKAGIVAFQVESGETAWVAVNDQASYSAPIAATIDQQRQLLCVTRLNFVSLDPKTGKENFRTPFGQRGPTVNGAVPVIAENYVLLTASYGIGAQWLQLGKTNVDVVWSNTILSSQYTTPILHDGVIYGIDGRQDGGTCALKCFDPNTQQELWSKTGVKYSTLIAADGKLFMMQTDGVLKMLKLSKERYDELDSATLLSGTTRALPALAAGHFYIRNEKTLRCVDLSAH